MATDPAATDNPATDQVWRQIRRRRIIGSVKATYLAATDVVATNVAATNCRGTDYICM
jgi:hypothetical protein